jgi:hypothetical protein
VTAKAGFQIAHFAALRFSFGMTVFLDWLNVYCSHCNPHHIPEIETKRHHRPNVVFMIGSKLLLRGLRSGDPILEYAET